MYDTFDGNDHKILIFTRNVYVLTRTVESGSSIHEPD